MRPIGCPEMSATKYQAQLLNIPEEKRLHLSTVLASTQTTSALVAQDTVCSLQLFRPTLHITGSNIFTPSPQSSSPTTTTHTHTVSCCSCAVVKPQTQAPGLGPRLLRSNLFILPPPPLVLFYLT